MLMYFFFNIFNSLSLNFINSRKGFFIVPIFQLSNLNGLINRIVFFYRNNFQGLSLASLSEKAKNYVKNVMQILNPFDLITKRNFFFRNIAQDTTISNFITTRSITRFTINIIQNMPLFNILNVIPPLVTSQGDQPSGSFGGFIPTDEKICRETYGYILLYGRNATIFSSNVINGLKEKYNKTSSLSIIDYHVVNWQFLCSDLVNRTLNPELVCNKMYDTFSKDKNATLPDIDNLRRILNPNIKLSNTLLIHYLVNYDSLCFDLTKRRLPVDLEISSLTGLKRSEAEFCNPYIESSSFAGKVLGLVIPIPTIEFKELSCSQINFWRWFVEIEQDLDTNYIKGIRIYWVAALVIVVIILLLFIFFVKHRRVDDRLGNLENKIGGIPSYPKIGDFEISQ